MVTTTACWSLFGVWRQCSCPHRPAGRLLITSTPAVPEAVTAVSCKLDCSLRQPVLTPICVCSTPCLCVHKRQMLVAKVACVAQEKHARVLRMQPLLAGGTDLNVPANYPCAACRLQALSYCAHPRFQTRTSIHPEQAASGTTPACVSGTMFRWICLSLNGVCGQGAACRCVETQAHAGSPTGKQSPSNFAMCQTHEKSNVPTHVPAPTKMLDTGWVHVVPGQHADVLMSRSCVTNEHDTNISARCPCSNFQLQAQQNWIPTEQLQFYRTVYEQSVLPTCVHQGVVHAKMLATVLVYNPAHGQHADVLLLLPACTSRQQSTHISTLPMLHRSAAGI
jgi:hypothetical protein